MPAPSPDLIVANPAPLSPTDFPYALEEFPAHTLATLANVIPLAVGGDTRAPRENPHRYED